MTAVILAVGFERVGDLGLSLGYGERVPPAIAAWGPTGVLAVLAGALSWRWSG
jgi:lipopolysaccharide export LptBFGC system permease protein LptF